MHEQTGLRRNFLRLAALGALSLPALSAKAAGSSGKTARTTPAAPYPHEPSPTGKTSLANFWSRSGLLRRDIRPNMDGQGLAADGLQLDLVMRLVTVDRWMTPVAGAAVYVWHSDARGEYSVYGVNDASYLRGIGVTGSDGRVCFRSVYPGTYLGREPHIHFEVYPSLSRMPEPDRCLLRSRILFPETVSREVYKSNLVYRPSLKTFESLNFGRPGTGQVNPDAASQVALVSGDARKSVRASISVPVSA